MYSEDPEALADYAKYLCVLVAGFLERAIEQILHSHAEAQSSPSVSRYVGRTLRSGNLQTERLLQLVEHFDASWRASLESFLTDEHRAAIGSIYGNRNQIAHGDDVGLSYQQVATYYSRVKEVVRHLEELTT